MKKAGIIGIVVVALLVVVGAYALAQNKAAVLSIGDAGNKVYGWRYKMTVSVETPEGLKTGSAVREVSVKFEPRPGYKPHPYYVTTKVKGEAVVVDLGERGVLFALIDPDDYRFVFEAFPGPPGLTPEGMKHYADLLPGQKSTLDSMPWLVTFVDRSEPRTIKAVTKANISDVFGQGVTLNRVGIEITTDAIIWGVVDKYLEWFGTRSLGLGFWDPKNPEAEKYLTSSSFRLGADTK